MAGRPRTQAKKLRDALAREGIDADQLLAAAPGALPNADVPPAAPTPGVEPLDTRAPARTHARRPPQLRSVPIGATTRAMVDSRVAGEVDRLAELLQPGLTLRLERVRPTWAAGWIEDVPIDDQGVGDLLSYISEEHGGAMYRGTVFSDDQTILYVAKIPVSGPPRVRGKITSREYWDGGFAHDNATRESNPKRESNERPVSSNVADMVELLKTFQSLGENRQTTLIDAVREMSREQRETSRDLVNAVMESRTAEQNGGLVAQLRQVMQASQVFDEFREVLGTGHHGGDDDDRRGDGSDQMINQMFAQAMQNEMRKGQGGGGVPFDPRPFVPPYMRQPQQRPRPQQPQPGQRPPQQQQRPQQPSAYRRVQPRKPPAPNTPPQGEQQ